MSEVAFVVNPVAGTRSKSPVLRAIETAFRQRGEEPIIHHWHEIADLDWVISDVLTRGAKKVVAVGGDGTVNAIASHLVGTNACLGIIPRGSGNGLARHLGIPLGVSAAIDTIFNGKVRSIDVCSVNGKKFFCTAGTGFDALISAAFAEQKTRGKFTYAKLILAKSLAYQGKNYKIEIDDKIIDREAFIVTVANANQFGNNFQIAPQAIIDDGIMDVCVLNTFNKLALPEVSMRLLNGSIESYSNYESFKAKVVKLHLPEEDWLHLDGEPERASGVLHFKMESEKLQMIV